MKKRHYQKGYQYYRQWPCVEYEWHNHRMQSFMMPDSEAIGWGLVNNDCLYSHSGLWSGWTQGNRPYGLPKERPGGGVIVPWVMI